MTCLLYSDRNEKICSSYVGLACVDGSCPIARANDYEVYCQPSIKSCDECWMYKGCKDCAIANTEYCKKEVI